MQFSKHHLALATIGLCASSAMAAPVDPLPLFQENFDSTASNTPGPNAPWMLSSYVSAATDYTGTPLNQTYNADPAQKYATTDTEPYWSSAKYCNGMWLSYSTTNPNAGLSTTAPKVCNGRQATYNPALPGNEARAWKNLQVLANVLGQVSNPGTGPQDNLNNHAIAAFTEAYNDVGLREWTILKSNKPIPVPAGGRFLSFSVAAAAVNCSNPGGSDLTNEPQYMFKLVTSSGTELEMNTAALNPCIGGKPYTYSASDTTSPGMLPSAADPANLTVYAAQIKADKAYLIEDASVGLRFTNKNGRGNGNDGAFDNITMLDVSPHLDKSFAPATVQVGQTSTLTFKASNTSDLLEKKGWTFTDTLPAGLVVANPANVQNQCTGSVVTAAAGANTIAVTNGTLLKDVEDCTISVDVTAQVASPIAAAGVVLPNNFGTQPGPGIVTTTALVPGAGATLTVMPQADMAATPTPPENFALGVPGSITTSCINNGPDVAVAATCVVTNAPAGASTVCTPASGSTDLQPNQAISCVTTFKMDVAGTVSLTTTAGSSSTDPVSTNNAQTAVVTAVSPAADMSATSQPNVATTLGATATVTSTCTNNGPDIAANATCTVSGAPAGSTTVCTPSSPATSLAVGASMQCVTTMTPTTADPITLTTTAGTSTAEINSSNNVATTNATVSNTPAAPTAVPSLGQWATALLTLLLGGLAAMGWRRAPRR